MHRINHHLWKKLLTRKFIDHRIPSYGIEHIATSRTVGRPLTLALGFVFLLSGSVASGYVLNTDSSTDGTDKARTYLLVGAGQALNTGGNNVPITLDVNGGVYGATVGTSADPSLLKRFSNDLVGVSDAWSAGILAASWGSDGSTYDAKPDVLPDGGNGGAVTVNVGSSASILLLDESAFHDELGGNRLTVAGVLALSQGGTNSSWLRELARDEYSESGNGGAVTVNFQGRLASQGSYTTASGAPVVSQVVGILAISRGGQFACTYQDCRQNYDPGFNFNLPGNGGDVTVNLSAVPGSTSPEIDLQTGSAIGVMAISANGAIVADQDEAGFNVDASSVKAGSVRVTIGDASATDPFNIKVGKSDQTLGMGVLAVSAGSETTIPLAYQSSDDIRLRPSGGTAYGGDVTVNNAHGVIEARGQSAFGIVALSLGAEAAIGLRGISAPGIFEIGKKHPDKPDVSSPLGNVTVNNGAKSSIVTLGAGAHGIVAASLGAGGIIHISDVADYLTPDPLDPDLDFDADGTLNGNDPDDDDDGIADALDPDDNNNGLLDNPCTTSSVPGEAPYCAGQQTAYVVGRNQGGGAPRQAGVVTVTNDGTILTGDPNDPFSTYHAAGIVAQSVGGPGGSSTGGFLFFHGDKAGSGGDGGSVSVTNGAGASITTWGHLSTGILAQSIGGGGGSSGSNWGFLVSVGGSGGAGGNGSSVGVALSGAGRIETHGDFSQGVLAQSIGGGGGSGGGASQWFVFLGLSVGGAGGSGGNGGDVSVTSTLDQSDLANAYADPALHPDVFEIWTEGAHGVGILAQSIGGGGGVGGNAKSKVGGVVFSFNVAIGGSGGDGGVGGGVSVDSYLDVFTAGDDAIGILAQSIGGGGGVGGGAVARSYTVEVPSPPNFPIPNVTGVLAVGGKGGIGDAGSSVTVNNGGTVLTQEEQAIGILAQSIGGGGGSGGDAKSINTAIKFPSTAGAPTFNFAANVTVGVGGQGGSGGTGGDVTVDNHGLLGSAGRVITQGDNSIGILAQSIGGGGGNGGQGDVQGNTVGLLGLLIKNPQTRFAFSVGINVGVGGSGGSGNTSGTVELNNGSAIAPGIIETYGGNSPGMVAQSIGGGGGVGGSSLAAGMGSLLNVNVGVGGAGESGGAGGTVRVVNPLGARITTGSVLAIQSTPEEIADGYAPFSRVTTGGGSSGIVAQSIGGGGGMGGSADAIAYFTGNVGKILKDVSSGAAIIRTFKYFKTAVGERPTQFWQNLLKMAVNVSVGGDGGSGNHAGAVYVTNDGMIETLGEQAFGIHAQSIGGGGGAGGWADPLGPLSIGQDFVEWFETLSGASFEIGIGGRGGAAGDGSTVDVTNSSSIQTSGAYSHGVFAQSIGGGGGFGGIGANSMSGLISIGVRSDGDTGISGKGDTVTVTNTGTIHTFGNDAIGVLAQSIGGGGGSAALPCTNAVNIAEQSPCWGNNDAQTADDPSPGFEYRFPLRISIRVGGKKSAQPDHEEDGGEVSVAAGDITTRGARSMAVVAQSIGGGGGFIGGDSDSTQVVELAPSAGFSHTHGNTVTVDVTGALRTYGDGAWGVLAQSIGGSGGFAGDPALPLGSLVSNTVQTVCCEAQGESFTTGADGGTVNVNVKQNNSIITTGKNAHGIFAQSVGGGGGIGSHWFGTLDLAADDDLDGIKNGDDPEYWSAHRPDSLYAGNTTASDWLGQSDDVWWTGQGGAINVTVESGAHVSAGGEGSIGIIAQSTGDKNYMSKISLSIAGTVSGGSGYALDGYNETDSSGPAAILISGGESRRNQHDLIDTPNTVTVTSTGKVYGHVNADGIADLNAVAIRSIYGYTDVTIEAGGVVAGEIFLGRDTDAGSVFNDGTWYAGRQNSFANQSFHNNGRVVISQPTVMDGSLKSSIEGELLFDLDPSVHFDQAALTVTGLARIEGTIVPVIENLLSGEFRLLKAGTLEWNASIDDPLLFNWTQRVTTDGELRLSALADFRPAGLELSVNKEQAAAYLERAWENADPHFAGHFAYMLRMASAAQHAGMLDALGGAELLHQHGATLMAIPTLLGDAIDCPTMGGADVIVGEDSCAWMGVGQSWGRYSGKDTRSNDTDGDLFSAGLQKEFRPGWFLSGVIGRLSSDEDAGNARSSGRTTIGSVGLKHQRGNWILGASLAWGEGSYDSVRSFALPLAGGTSAPDATFRSDSEMDIRALRTRVSYEFGDESGYLRPTLDVDALQTETSGFEEEAGEHRFRLRGDGDSKNEVRVTPHVELGRIFDLGGENRLRAYVDAGVRLAPDADREMDIRIAGADAGIGFMRNRIDVPLATGLLKVGAQIYRNDALDLRLEYGLEANDDFRNETATARVAWHF